MGYFATILTTPARLPGFGRSNGFLIFRKLVDTASPPDGLMLYPPCWGKVKSESEDANPGMLSSIISTFIMDPQEIPGL